MIYFRISIASKVAGRYHGFTVRIDKWGLVVLAWLALCAALVLI